MSFLSKARVTTQVSKHKNRFDLSSTTVTTQDFYKPKAVYTRQLMPGQSIDIDMASTTEMQPLANPFFGSAKLCTRCFFVPFRTVMEGFNNFIEDTPYSYSDGTLQIPTIVPTTSIEEMVRCFTAYPTLAVGRTTQGNAEYDFYFSEDQKYYNLTVIGRLFWDILQSLGYKLSTCPVNPMTVSALPLLSWAKIFTDWFSNPAYANFFAMNKWFKGKVRVLNFSDIYTILINCYNVIYEQDYFTSAWDNPVTPNNRVGNSDYSASSKIHLNDPTNDSTASGIYKGSISYGENRAYGSSPHFATESAGSVGNVGVNGSVVTQWMIMALHKVTDYVKRHQLVGSRLLDRYMADWGIQLDSAKLDRCLYLGKYDAPIKVGKVMQTSANTESGTSVDSGLGNYGGNGTIHGGTHFHYEAEEFGMLLIISYIVPNFMYVDGMSKFMTHGVNGKFDFFTPAFDSMGTYPVLHHELASGTRKLDDVGEIDSPLSIFGYQNRYAEYCVPQDMLLGDFTFDTRNANIKSWYLARRYRYTDIVDKQLDQKHTLDFTVAKPDDFMNIFVNESNQFDHFYTIFNFNITSFMPKKQLFDVYDFEDDGKNMILSINGTNLD